MFTTSSGRRRERGLSLVELIVFIVVVGVAVSGVLAALNISTRASADPMIQKQALSIAEALLEEAQLQAFTYCDPDDPAAATATSAGGCATQEVIGTEGGETRTGTPPFDNVSDYHGFGMGGGVVDISGNAIPGLGAYTASVTVSAQGLSGVPANEALLIGVTVTGPGNTTVRVDGYRMRYAPNALP